MVQISGFRKSSHFRSFSPRQRGSTEALSFQCCPFPTGSRGLCKPSIFRDPHNSGSPLRLFKAGPQTLFQPEAGSLTTLSHWQPPGTPPGCARPSTPLFQESQWVGTRIWRERELWHFASIFPELSPDEVNSYIKLLISST